MTGGAGDGAACEVIVALDEARAEDAEALVSRLGGEARWLKIGLELFCAEGPAIVRRLSRDHRVMLDLKLHDIPRTAERAAERAAELGARLVTVHAAGGRAMLEAAAAGAARGAAGRAPGERAKILAVTVLTSMAEAEVEEAGCRGPIAELARGRARLAAEAGCDGVVASPREAADLRAELPAGSLIATPGVRPAGAAAGDQARAATPGGARAAGADFVIVGRPVARAEDPLGALRSVRAEVAGAGDGSI